MDGIKKLAEKLQRHTREERPLKTPHTLSINHKAYMLLFAYCRRKDLAIGEVVSDLMQVLIDELLASGELTSEDQDTADEYDRAKEQKDDKKQMKRVG